jgi:hypothetical protein
MMRIHADSDPDADPDPQHCQFHLVDIFSIWVLAPRGSFRTRQTSLMFRYKTIQRHAPWQQKAIIDYFTQTLAAKRKFLVFAATLSETEIQKNNRQYWQLLVGNKVLIYSNLSVMQVTTDHTS